MLKNLLLLSGFSTFVVIVIVGLNIFHKITISTLPEKTQMNIVPITPVFNKQTLEDLKKREPVTVNLNEKSTVISEDSKTIDTKEPTEDLTDSTASQSAPDLFIQP